MSILKFVSELTMEVRHLLTSEIVIESDVMIQIQKEQWIKGGRIRV